MEEADHFPLTVGLKRHQSGPDSIHVVRSARDRMEDGRADAMERLGDLVTVIQNPRRDLQAITRCEENRGVHGDRLGEGSRRVAYF